MPDNSGQDYYIQVSESIRSVYELTTRVDERVKLMMQKVEQLEGKLDAQLSEVRDLEGRVKVIEANPANMTKISEEMHDMDVRIRALEMRSGQNDNRWKTILSFVVQLIWVLLAGYLFMKFGFSAPNVP